VRCEVCGGCYCASLVRLPSPTLYHCIQLYDCMYGPVVVGWGTDLQAQRSTINEHSWRPSYVVITPIMWQIPTLRPRGTIKGIAYVIECIRALAGSWQAQTPRHYRPIFLHLHVISY
jgi:hypothetical protein